jgi:hypothetical protein
MASYWKPIMLGDIAESALGRVGVTKALVARVAGGCGCQSRQDWLNLWGLRFQSRIYHSRAWWRPHAVAALKALGRLG